MKAKHLLVLSIILSVAMVLMTACTTQLVKTADTAAMGPQWVMKGSGAFDVEGSKVFYGVGAASGIKNKALLRKSSDNRAPGGDCPNPGDLCGLPGQRLHGLHHCR